MASDLDVTVGQRAFHAHQYPLYALVALLRSQYALLAFSLSTVIASTAAAVDEGRAPGPYKRISHSSLAPRSPSPCPLSLPLLFSPPLSLPLHFSPPLSLPLLFSPPLSLPLLFSPPSFSLPPTPPPFSSPPGSITARDERVCAQPSHALLLPQLASQRRHHFLQHCPHCLHMLISFRHTLQHLSFLLPDPATLPLSTNLLFHLLSHACLCAMPHSALLFLFQAATHCLAR
ncbi:unnamed protein product [Closterium sp. NIES-65]|nr:unnamed protein product [Closterium sp. NIES-65]